MHASPDTLDCRGLTPALTVLRIKQAVCAEQFEDAPLPVILGSDCSRENVSRALAELAERVRYVTDGAPASPNGAVDSEETTADLPPAEQASQAPEAQQPTAEQPTAEQPAAPWWQRGDLRYQDGRLHLGRTDLDELADRVGTPAYVCRADRVAENIRRLSEAMSDVGLDHRIYYAIKANRTAALLAYLRAGHLCGVDVCSVGELMHVLACGFPVESISFTGTSLARREIETLARFPDLRVNLDSLSALDNLGRLSPGREVGLRINPAVGVGYQGNERLNYSGAPTTKFGIYLDHLAEAKAIAQRWGLRLTRLHFHVGCGYLDGQLDELCHALDAADAFTEHLSDLREVNLGGGLGVPHSATDRPLDLGRWAAEVARRFGDRGLQVAVEPGDYLVKDAGLLLTSVTYVERRRDVLFAGLDAGFNLAMEPAFYGLPCEPVAVAPHPDASSEVYTVVGNINEALDKWAVDHPMPRLSEGDHVALINAGGYASSMRSEHCLRGPAQEVLLVD